MSASFLGRYGSFAPGNDSPRRGGGPRAKDEVPTYLREIRNALKVGMEALLSGSSLEGVEAAVEYMEDAEVFNAGRGNSLTIGGRLQLDTVRVILTAGCAFYIRSMIKRPHIK